MAYSNYPGGFKAGVTIRGVPIELTHPGRVFWVGNSATRLENEKTAADGNDGSFLAPFSTLEGALNNSGVTAARGDVLFIRPGFTLTVSTATALNFDKAGIAIIGLGHGASRPTITLDTANTATIPVTAANMAVRNILFIGNFLDIASLFTLTTARNFSVEDCEMRDTTAALGFINLIDTSAVANDADGLYFARNVAVLLDVGATTIPFNVDATQARWVVKDNFLHTAAVPTSLGLFDCAASAGLTDMMVTNNYYRHAGTDITYGVFIGTVGVSTASGVIMDNVVATLSAAASAAISVAVAGSGVVRIRNTVRPTQVAALRATEIDVIRQASLVSA
jgi:hypothetical protein